MGLQQTAPAVDGRLVAQIRHGVVHASVHLHARGIDSVARIQRRVRLDIGRREAHAASETVPVDDDPFDYHTIQIFSVSFCTSRNCEKNSLAKTRSTVYDGIASSIPTIPANDPAIRITMNISSGCAFTRSE